MSKLEQPGRFTKCPPHMPRETGQSYLGRLTTYFGYGNPKLFCREYMLDMRGIHHGEPDALERLAAMTGTDPDALIRATPRRLDKAFMVINGETLHTRLNPRHLISICPVCAMEDIAANPRMPLDQAVYGRSEWMLGVVDACAKHGVKLVSHRAPVRTAEKLDVGYETGYLLEELRFVTPEPAALDDFQLYVLSRIGSVDPRPSPLLDPLPLVIVTQLCQAAGLDVLRRRGIDNTPSDAERRAAGFEMLGHGADRLEQVFIELRRGLRLSEMTSRIIPRLLEYLHEAEHYGRDLEGFVDVLVDVCFRNMPYAAGQVLLGRPCPNRWVYDFPSAMAAYGIGRHHLDAFILGTPELAAYVGDRRQDSLINADVADRLFLGRMPFLTSKDVSRALGWDMQNPRTGLEPMIKAGVIKPEAGASTAEIPPIFSEPELNCALESFFARFEPADPHAEARGSIHVISQTIGISNDDLWPLLASGKIKTMGRVPDEGWVRGMRLDIREVLGAATGVDQPLNTNDVAERLDVAAHQVRNLTDNDYLPSTPVPEHLASKMTIVFARRDVETFLTEFVSPKAARAMLPGSPSFSRLGQLGLKPVIQLEAPNGNQARTIFFARADVEAICQRDLLAEA